MSEWNFAPLLGPYGGRVIDRAELSGMTARKARLAYPCRCRPSPDPAQAPCPSCPHRRFRYSVHQVGVYTRASQFTGWVSTCTTDTARCKAKR
jgi:hypothetical protein